MGWDYSNLSHEAKEHGGPEQYISDIKDDARKDGHMDMMPLIGLAFTVGATVSGFVMNWWNNRETKKKAKEAEKKIVNKCKPYEIELEDKQDLKDEENNKREEGNDDGQSISKRK